MVHAAHASRYLWQDAGDAGNWAVGEWQVAHVYTLLGRTEQALHHARLCLETCERYGAGDWQLFFAHEALCELNHGGFVRLPEGNHPVVDLLRDLRRPEYLARYGVVLLVRCASARC